ncbi:MAG: hypothetical protein SGI72_00985 [Planctomycetota bacterium]|nr:hypothetical protein [Planctomycetota bacterium]
MKKIIVLCAVTGLALALYSTLSPTVAVENRRPVVVANPKVGGVHAIVVATPFTLQKAWTHEWRAEKPTFDAGWLVVLEVDTGLVQPTQMEEPVLYAGTETVERINHGEQSGRVIAIVPSKRNRDGTLALDLASTPIWFGARELPERIDAVRVAAEVAKAEQLGVTPLRLPNIGAVLHLASRDDLDPLCGELVLQHSPQEQDTGMGLLAPRVK